MVKTFAPTEEQLAEILAAHALWITNEEIGKKADLSSADLRSADLRSANLRSADLRSADLRSADLRSADLRGADLSSANLSSANLSSANLSSADLSGADLRSADLRSADLRSADLRSADLRSADLRSANLRSANLRSANLPTGEKYEMYLAEVVPALLVAGGKTIEEIFESGSFDCHSWSNCPMHVAFGIDTPSKGPKLLIPRIEQFVQLYDDRLIPPPVKGPDGQWVFPVSARQSKGA
jgi:hypothetical protein